MYVLRNIEAYSRNHCCRRKAIILTYFYAYVRAGGSVGECMRVCVGMGVGAQALACACALVALLIQHALLRHIVICDHTGSTAFFDIIS